MKNDGDLLTWMWEQTPGISDGGNKKIENTEETKHDALIWI